MNIRRISLCLLLLVLVPWGLGAAGSGKLVIFHMNDVHGKIHNFARAAAIIERERAENPDTLFLVAGDLFSGHPVVDRWQPRGEPMLQLLNLLRCDAQTIGNHEFDYGQETLKHYMETARFPLLCANVTLSSAVLPAPKPAAVLTTAAGWRVAVLGLIQVEPERGQPSTSPEHLAGLTFTDGVARATDFRSLRQQADVFVVLSHLGVEADEKLAKSMPEIDVIVGGHSHTILCRPRSSDGVLIAQAGSDGEYLGRVELTMENGRITGKKGELIELDKAEAENPRIAATVASFLNNPEFRKKAVDLPLTLQGKDELGSLICSAIRRVMNVDITFHNNGGIRVDRLERGPVRVQDVFSLLPFQNPIVTVELTPERIRAFIRADFERQRSCELQTAGIGILVRHTLNSELKEIVLQDESGRPLDESRRYRVGVNSYLYQTSPALRDDAAVTSRRDVADCLLEYFAGKPDLRAFSGVRRIRQEMVAGGVMTLVGNSKIPLSNDCLPGSHSTTAGNLIADAVRLGSGAEIAVYADYLLPPGTRIAGDVFREALPNLYRNINRARVVVAELSGADLRRFLEERCRRAKGFDQQLSGLHMVIAADKTGAVRNVLLTLPDGRPLDDARVYRVAFDAGEFSRMCRLNLAARGEPKAASTPTLKLLEAHLRQPIGAEVRQNRIALQSSPGKRNH